MLSLKVYDPRHEPTQGEAWRRLHGENAPSPAMGEPLRGVGDLIECRGHILQERSPGCSRLDAPARPMEQPSSHIVFELPDLLADGAMGNAKLLGRRCDAGQSRRSFESAQGVEGR